eukprot:2532774-Prymnesium_polylepis.1
MCADAAHALELGAGLGVPGLVAGRHARRLTLTDNNDSVIERLGRSAVHNAPLMRAPALATVRRLEWGGDSVPADLRGR